MKTPKTLIAILALLSLTACEAVPNVTVVSATTDKADETTPTAASPKTVASAPSLAPASVAAVQVTTIPLTVYKLTATRAPVNGWSTKTYTSSGSCVVYQANTYCWDDGVKTLAWSSAGNNYGPYTYSYWNMSTDGATWTHTSGVLQQDLMVAPRLITHNLDINIIGASVNTVLTTGAASQVNCTEQSGILNCISFSVDLNQAHL